MKTRLVGKIANTPFCSLPPYWRKAVAKGCADSRIAEALRIVEKKRMNNGNK